jgi:multidrug efflux pump
MNISSTSINRPVLATVISIVLVLLGVIGYSFLGVREYPSVDPPIVTVSTNYIGANADVIEAQITEPLEESINGIAGIRSLTSVSRDGRSTITVEFELGVEMEAAANDVRDRVSRSLRSLPPDIDPPVVIKSDADARPIIAMTVQSNSRNLMELSALGNNVFKERLQTIPGVSEVRIWGEKRYSIKLRLDPARLAAYKLTAADVRSALNRENVELPTGRIEGYGTELTIRAKGRLTTPEEFNNMIIREDGNAMIRLRDLGRAELAPENERSILRGKNVLPMIAVVLTPQPGANQIEIADEFYRRFEVIKKDIPEDVQLNVALDTTESIRKAITEVEETILMAFGLVVIVILLFLRNWRTTLIPVIAIPISLVATFFIMYLSNYSINILTLLGIVLATGLVVDDAIVVMENIYQKIESGMSPKEAAHAGSKEIYFAIISTTITLVAVFFPIIFLQGLTGRLFREFGVVVAGAVAISALVSLTLTPMMSSKLLRRSDNQTPFFRRTERQINSMIEWYRQALSRFISIRWLAWVIMIASVALILLVGRQLPSELAPLEDRGRINVLVTGPEGTSFDLMDRYMLQLLQVADTLPETHAIICVTSPGFSASGSTNSGFMRMIFTDPSERERSQQELTDLMNSTLRKYNFAKAFAVQEQTIGGGGGGGGGLPIQVVIKAPDFEKLKKALPAFMDKAQSDPRFSVVDLDLKFNKPELNIEIDRDRALALGVNVRDIAESIQLLYSGQRFGYFIMDSKQYYIIGEAARGQRDEPADLSSMFVRNKRGEMVQLDNVVKIKQESNPPQLYRYNRYVSATVSAQAAEGLTLGQGIAAMQEIADETLDESFSTDLAGTSKEFRDSSGSLLFAFLLALVLIYLVLAAQFESYRDPLTIMFTVPLALAGAVLTLWLFGQTINIFSQIGVIVLIGIVTKNGILIVEFANQRKDAGLSVREAVVDAATRRLRPILMTSLATVLGALPIALALGASSGSRIPMGIAIIGGLLFSLILTLFVIPALYTYLTKRKAEE